MSKNFHRSAEMLICDLKHSIDEICEKCGDDSLLDSLSYAGNEYGVMQRAELREIIDLLADLKLKIDDLFVDCLNIQEEDEIFDNVFKI